MYLIPNTSYRDFMINNKSKEKQLIVSSDDNPLGDVPEDKREGMFSMMVVLLGFTFFTSTMFGGGEVGAHFRFLPDMMIAIVVGNLLLGIYVAVLGYISQKTGYSSVILARYSFGDKGSRLVDILFGVTQIGWYAWGTATISMVFVKILGLSESLVIPLMIFFGFLFGLTSYIGYKGIQMLSNITVPLMAVLIFWSFKIGFDDVGGITGLNRIPDDPMTFTRALTIIIGTFISGGTQATNWTRFSRTPKIAVIACMAAFFFGNGLMIFAGAFGGYVYQNPDIVEVLLIQGLWLPALIMLFFNVWTTQDNAIYAVSVAGCNLFRTDKRRLMNFLGCGVSTLLAIAGMYNWLIPYITIMGTIIPPIGGVIMGDYLIKHKNHYPKLEKVKMKTYNYAGIIAYAIGAFLAYFSPGVPPINGVLGAFIAYPIVDKVLNSINKPQAYTLLTDNNKAAEN